MLKLVVLVALLQDAKPEELRSLHERERVARLELEAAKSGELYFVLDVPASTLRFALRGVVLETFSVQEVSIGRRLGSGSTADPIRELHTCEKGIPDTPVEIVPGAPLPDLAPPEPPPWLDLGCGPSLAIHIDSEAGTGWVHGLLEHVAGDTTTNARLRIVVPDEDYAALAATMPPKSRWIFAFYPMRGAGYFSGAVNTL